MPDRDVYGHTIFCDDVRQEVNSKISLMGVWPPVILVHGTFPFIVPKLCMSVYFYELQKLAFVREDEVPILVFGPGQTIDNPNLRAMVPVASKELIDAATKEPTYGSQEPLYAIGNIILMAAPFVIQEPGWVRVRAIYRKDVLSLGSLRFDQGPIPS
jgi:hypothetical protein